MIKIEKEKIDLALYIIELKEADLIKKSKNRTYDEFKQEIEEAENSIREFIKNM